MNAGAVYVDAAIWPYRRMMMCHMLADRVEDLHAMADRIGVARRWFQNKKYPHYDICKSKRVLAVKFGAIEIGRREFLDITQRLIKSNDMARRAHIDSILVEATCDPLGCMEDE